MTENNDQVFNYQCYICPVCFDDHGSPGQGETLITRCKKEDIYHELEKERAKTKKLKEVIHDLAPWASAALDDKSGCCDKLKKIFERVIELDTLSN